jgi:DNA-binding MarR family transcriptional regulator
MACTDEQTDIDISDNVLLMLPLFARNLLRGGQNSQKSRVSNLDMPVLGMLIHSGPLPMTEISERLNVSKPNMTHIIDRLISEGKVGRSRGSKDRRVVNIRITPRGLRFAEGHRKIVKENVRRNISALSGRDRRILCESLDNIRMIVSKIG